MKNLLDVGVTAVRASSPEQFSEVAAGKYRFGTSAKFNFFRDLNITTVHGKLLALLQFLWLPKQLWILSG